MHGCTRTSTKWVASVSDVADANECGETGSAGCCDVGCVGLAQAARLARDPTLVKSKVDPFSRRPTQLSNYWSTKAEAADAAASEESPAEEAPVLKGKPTHTACPPSLSLQTGRELGCFPQERLADCLCDRPHPTHWERLAFEHTCVRSPTAVVFTCWSLFTC
jgi:hypothetical protein